MISEAGDLKFRSADTTGIGGASGGMEKRPINETYSQEDSSNTRMPLPMPHNGSPGTVEPALASSPTQRVNIAMLLGLREPMPFSLELGGCIRPGEQVSDGPSRRVPASFATIVLYAIAQVSPWI